MTTTVVGALVLAVLVVVGFTRGSGPPTTAFDTTDRVVLVAVPGLRWQDLDAIATEHLEALLGASALLSVRSIGTETTPLEGYLAFGAGNRLDTDRTAELDDPDARCVPALVDQARDEADDGLNGAEPGALGTALHAAGLTTAVAGSTDAVVALMDAEGCVDRHDHIDGFVTPDHWADVTLIELGGLESEETAAARAEALASIDASIGALDLPADALVVLFAPSAPDGAGEVVVVGVRDVPGTMSAPASMASPSTRRADYVQLTDLAPLVLERLGLEVPSAMSGTAAAATAADDDTDADRTSRLADLSERVSARDELVGPVSVVLVVLTVMCGVAALARRGRLARMLAPIVIAYPTVTFLMGLVAFHQLPVDFVVVAVPVVAAVIAAVATSATARWGAWAPVATLASLLWLTLVVDVITGGTLQINTPLGYSPTVAGRFQGFGNLAFGLVAAAAMAVALLVAQLAPRVGLRRSVHWSLWTGAITLVAVAAPAFGADVGGTLALLPAIAGLTTVLAGKPIKWWRAVAVMVATVAVVGVLAVIDRARPEESRTHLGRFLDELLDGDGWLIIRRKLDGNLSILTSTFWAYLLIALVIVGAVAAWRRRDALRSALRDRPLVHAFLTGFAIVAVLGFAVNDSGLAVPAIMTAVAVPWLVAVCVPVVRRAGR